MKKETMVEEFKKNTQLSRGIVTLSCWECDCSGHPYRPYGFYSYMVDRDKATEITNLDTSKICYPEVTTISHNGEILPHVVLFQEIW